MRKRTIATLLIVVMGLTACSYYLDDLDVNDNPNQASDAPKSTVLTSAFTSLIISHTGEDARLATIWSQQFSGSDRSYSAYQLYNVTAGDFDYDKY